MDKPTALQEYLRRLWSRRLHVAILGCIAGLLQKKLGLNLSIDELLVALSPLASFVLGESYVDAQKVKQPRASSATVNVNPPKSATLGSNDE